LVKQKLDELYATGVTDIDDRCQSAACRTLPPSRQFSLPHPVPADESPLRLPRHTLPGTPPAVAARGWPRDARLSSGKPLRCPRTALGSRFISEMKPDAAIGALSETISLGAREPIRNPSVDNSPLPHGPHRPPATHARVR
jgi:hypothetical protein